MAKQKREKHKENTPVEQGAKDSLQRTINALTLARDSKTEFAMCDHIDNALLEIGWALDIQKADQFEEMATEEVMKALKDHPSSPEDKKLFASSGGRRPDVPQLPDEENDPNPGGD